MALQPGEIVDGKYRIVRLVGEGGMGAVYEGENLRIKRKVAIKVLHGAVAEKADVVQRFEREAQAAGRIGSEHIVEVLDLGNLPGGERYMVMEFLEGEDLTTRIKRRGRLPPEQAAPLLYDVLEGLAAAHDASIIHRDLKPDNIFLLTKQAGKADFVKILDFGVSKFSALDAEMSMTRTGAVMGTPYYMSPEQAKGGQIDARSDLYAIGVVAYQMATGRVPFTAGSFNELLFKIALEQPEPLEQLVPNIHPAYVNIVKRGMHRDLNQRFQTAREFQEAVSTFMLTSMASPGASGGAVSGSHAAASPMTSSNPSLGGTPIPGTNVPGTNTPLGRSHPGMLGISQPAFALTPQPRKSKGPMVVALASVTVAILGAVGIGAYLLTQGPAQGQANAAAEAAAPASASAAASSTPDEDEETATAASSTAAASSAPAQRAAVVQPAYVGRTPLKVPDAKAKDKAAETKTETKPEPKKDNVTKDGRTINTGL